MALRQAFTDAGAETLQTFVNESPTPPSAAVGWALAQSILVIEQHLIELASRPPGPLSR